MSVFYTAFAQSDFFGKCIFLMLFILSSLCWILLLYKGWYIAREKRAAHLFRKRVERHEERLLHLDARALLGGALEGANPFADIFTSLRGKAIDLLNKNHFFLSAQKPDAASVHLSASDLEAVESHALTSISVQSKRLSRHLFFLSTIATLAPFLGLLGTVWGILVTFSALHQGGLASSNSLVLGGLATALATTVLGLLIAIPALVSYNYLKNATSDFTSDMEDFLYLLLSRLELQYRKTDIS